MAQVPRSQLKTEINAKIRQNTSGLITGTILNAIMGDMVDSASLIADVAPTEVADTNYAAQPTDRVVAYTAISISRTVNLPPAATFPTTSKLLIVDISGSCSATKTITADPYGSETVNGGLTVSIAEPFGYLELVSTGASWVVVNVSQFSFTYQPPANTVAVTEAYPQVWCTANNATLILAGCTFTQANVGNLITIVGPGPASSELWLTTTILAVSSVVPGQITLAVAPIITVPGFVMRAYWGSDQYAPIQNFLTLCRAIGACPYIASGIYPLSQGLTHLPRNSAVGFDNGFSNRAPLLRLDQGCRLIAMAPMTAVLTLGSTAADFSGYLRTVDFGGGTVDGGHVAKFCIDVPFFGGAVRHNQMTMNSLLAGVRWGNNTAPQSSFGSRDVMVTHDRDRNYGIPVIGISNGNPCTVTLAYQHGVPTGRAVIIEGSNQSAANDLKCIGTAASPTTVTLNNTDSTSWGAFTQGATASTSAATASGAVLTFSSVPSAVVAGMSVFDTSTMGAIPNGATVQSVTSTTVTLNVPVGAAGVGGGDTIMFVGSAVLYMTMPSNDHDFKIAAITVGSTTTVTLTEAHGQTIGQPWPVEINDVQGCGGLVDGLFIFTPTTTMAGTLSYATLTYAGGYAGGTVTVAATTAYSTAGATPYIGSGWLCAYRDASTVETGIWYDNATDANSSSTDILGTRIPVAANPFTGSGSDGKHEAFHFNNYPRQGVIRRGCFLGYKNTIVGGQVDLPTKFAYSFWGWGNEVNGRFNAQGTDLGAVANYSSLTRLENFGPLAYGSGGATCHFSGGGANADPATPLQSEVSVAGMTCGRALGYSRSNVYFPVGEVTISQPNSALDDRGGFVNILINGTFEIWQMGTGPFTVTSPVYTADGWFVSAVGASVSVQKEGTLGETQGSMQITGQVGVTGVSVIQRIESALSIRLENEPSTWQIKIYNGTGAAFTPTLSGANPGAQDNWASQTADPTVGTIALQPCPPGQTTIVSYTFSPSNPYLGYEVLLNFNNALNGAGKYVLISEADLRVTPAAQVGLNSGPPSPEFRPIAVETVLCQRWYRQEMPATGALTFTAYNAAGATNSVNLSLATPMFATPTAALIGTWAPTNASSAAVTGVTPQMIAFTWETTALGNSSIANPSGGGFSLSCRL